MAAGEGIVGAVPSLPSDPATAALQRLADELTQLRVAFAGMTQRLDTLATSNQQLHERLERSERARTDLAAQADHLVELLAEARREVRARGGC